MVLCYVKIYVSKYNVDLVKIGFMGFFVGVMILILVLIVDIDNCFVFLGYVYGFMNVIEVLVNVLLLFVVIVLDDGLFGCMGLEFVGVW